LKKWIYVALSGILAIFAGIGLVFVFIASRLINRVPVVKGLYIQGFMLGIFLMLLIVALSFLLLPSDTTGRGKLAEEISFDELVQEMRQAIEKASHNEDIRHSFTDYLKSLWVDSSTKLVMERALKEVTKEFHDQPWLFALYAELLMSDGRWADAEVMIKRAWELAPTDEYVRQIVKQWIAARSEKDSFRVSEMVRKLREVYPEGWLYLIEAEHMMKIGRTGKIEDVLIEAYRLSDEDMALLEVISAYLGYLSSEGREAQAYAFFERLKNSADRPLIYAIEAKLAVLVGDYDRALAALEKLKASDISPEVVQVVISDIMSSARSDGREDVLDKLFS